MRADFHLLCIVKLIDSAYRTSLRRVYVPSGIDSVRRFLKVHSEAEFLDVNGTITSTNGFYTPPTLSKSGLKLVCNVNTV
jgi:hypothetical protein